MINKALNSITIISGTDAPGIQIVPDGHGGYVIKRVPGWDPELMRELANSLQVVNAAARLKTAGLASSVIKTVGGLVEKQLGEHVGGAANVVVLHA